MIKPDLRQALSPVAKTVDLTDQKYRPSGMLLARGFACVNWDLPSCTGKVTSQFEVRLSGDRSYQLQRELHAQTRDKT